MLRILMIANSFGEDSTKYLHSLAAQAGTDCRVVNLYIGGCSLETHWQNVRTGAARYQYQLNGVITERYVSIEEVLREEPWDMVVTHQVSNDCGWMDSYEPFLPNLLSFIRLHAPQARLFLQETWAYEPDSTHPAFARYNHDQQEMYRRLHLCYTTMAEKYGLTLIPSGTIIQAARQLPAFRKENGGMSICRDGYHMSFLYGRYLLACIWAKKLLGVSLKDSTFVPSSPAVKEAADPALLAQLRQLADEGVTG